MMRTALLIALALVPMLIEARRSRRHERALRTAGAVEPSRDVYQVMQVAYPACFVAMAGEGWMRGAGAPGWYVAGALVFAAGKALKYWAIVSLGPRWTFRVLVIPGAPRVRRGPYRWLNHPNYVGVVGELAGFALLAHAPLTGAVAVVGFGRLMRARVLVEERALDA
jgi:methyltransferase